ncbi:MAG: 2-oxo acid dehydrogenase subunit E2 [Chloroflexi bacterium]|nr:2-oxo acid dehydrogenase subunit E2 [Chloroflexota bacterium]
MSDSFSVVPFSRERQVVVDSLAIGVERHVVHGLVEIDVTCARQFMREHKARTGEALSFTAYVVACLAHAVELHKSVQAYRDWRNRLVIFDEVDVVVMIEAEKDRVAIPHIVRAANRKTFRQIHDEIRAIQSKPTQSVQKSGGLARLGLLAPSFIRKFVIRLLMKDPHWMKNFGGTVVVTSIGMFGRSGGWGVAMMPMHTLGLVVGGMVEKPGVIDGRIEIREYLDLTINVDHDIVDGAPMARFTRELVALIESGYGLE